MSTIGELEYFTIAANCLARLTYEDPEFEHAVRKSETGRHVAARAREFDRRVFTLPGGHDVESLARDRLREAPDVMRAPILWQAILDERLQLDSFVKFLSDSYSLSMAVRLFFAAGDGASMEILDQAARIATALGLAGTTSIFAELILASATSDGLGYRLPFPEWEGNARYHATVDGVQIETSAPAGELARRLKADLPPAGRRPGKRTSAVERNVEWLYRHALGGQSIGDIAVEEFLAADTPKLLSQVDPSELVAEVRASRSSKIGKGITAAKDYLDPARRSPTTRVSVSQWNFVPVPNGE